MDLSILDNPPKYDKDVELLTVKAKRMTLQTNTYGVISNTNYFVKNKQAITF